jgi:alkanesulfonate monooxygenase SsuD/methylene tetrahydromethanopterin reductase-like flavin-dependent oxidoreductase (luciferase family)
MELGIISLSDIQTGPSTGTRATPAQRVEDAISYATLADRTGLDVFALGEHHTPEYAVASPAVVLAAIATRTGRSRLASGVTVLSVADPVRVYRDFAQLDLVSGGRAEIVAGRSAFPEPFAIFGVPISDYDAIFDEKLRLLVQLAAQDRATWSGHYRPALRDVPIVPRALQEPLPIWGGVGGSPGSAERAGRFGLPMVLGFIGGTFAHARNTIDIYRAAGEEAGHPEKLRVGLSTHFYAGATPSAALAVHPYYYEYLRPKTPGGRGWVVDPDSFAAGTRRGQALMVGSVDQLVEKIVDAHQLLGADRFIGQVDWGGLPRALVEESITRLATEIAPQVRAAVGAAGPGPVSSTA